LRLFAHSIRRAADLACCTPGSSSVARIATTAMTTTSSTRVNAERELECLEHLEGAFMGRCRGSALIRDFASDGDCGSPVHSAYDRHVRPCVPIVRRRVRFSGAYESYAVGTLLQDPSSRVANHCFPTGFRRYWCERVRFCCRDGRSFSCLRSLI